MLIAAQGLLDQLGGFERSSRSHGEDVCISERVPKGKNMTYHQQQNLNSILLQDLFENVQTVFAAVSPRQQTAIQLEAASGSSTCSQRPGGEGLDHDCHGLSGCAYPTDPRGSQGIPWILKRFDGISLFFPSRRCRRTMPSQLRPS